MDKELLIEEMEYYERCSEVFTGESKMLAILTLEDLQKEFKKLEVTK